MSTSELLLRIIELKRANDLQGFTNFMNGLTYEEAIQLKLFGERLVWASQNIASKRMEEIANDNEVH